MSSIRIKKTFTCFNCNLPFSVKDLRALRGPRFPLILKCGHTICEACAQLSLKEGPEITCGLCYHGTPCFSENVRADLPFNSYVLGVTAEKHSVPISEDSTIAFQPNRKKATSKIYSESREKCVECNRFADASCYQCDALYCNGCFSKVHRTAKALQKHKKYPLTQSDPKGVLPFPMCEEHPEQKLEFSCADCNKIVCSHCIILYHQRHEVCTVKKKNEESLEKLKDARSKAERVLKRLEHTKLKLEKIYSVPSVHHAQQLELQISRHFLYLHGLLQLMEETLLTQVQELKQGVSFSLQNVTRHVDDNIEKVSKLLNEAQLAKTPENLSKVDINSLVQKLEETENLPCHLISNVGEYVRDESAEFIVDTAFMDQIENHCKIELPPMECYTLVSTQELPEDATIDSLEDTDSLTETGSQLSLFSSVSQEGISGRESVHIEPLLAHTSGRVSAQIEPLLARIVPEDQSETVTHVRNDVGKGSQETVTVCYIKNPHCFFVHRERDKNTFRNMNYSLVKHIMTKPEPPSKIVEGEIYAVKYSEDKRWYRARALSLKSGGREPAAEVHYIDFGNTETVNLSRLRSLPDDIKSVPMLCAQCSLFGIAPVGGTWTAEANERFTEMVEGAQVVMVIMAYSSNIYEVDLCEVSGVVNSKVPFSVRDALVFLQFACFLDSAIPTPRTAANPMSSYLIQAIKAGELLQVKVSHINSPTSFYVQRTGAHARSLTSLKNEMKKYYFNPPEHKVYKPEIGMPCAVLNNSKTWCRGQVIGLPGNKKVKVFLVDTGSELELPWYEVFRLPEKFLAVPKQAIHCALNDVSPTLKSGWPAEIKRVMLDLTFKKSMRLFVDSVCDTNLFVTLYGVELDMDICINALLVREGYALSTGMSSVLVEYAKSGVSVQDTVPHKKAETRIISKVKPQAVHVAQPKPPNAVSEVTPDADIKENSDPFRLRVTVLALESPSCFYVKLKAVEDVLSELMKELQEYYNTSIGIETTWEEGEKCCVFNAADKVWCRGIITDITDDEASVFLTDFATYLKVPTNLIQTLDPRFSEVHSGAIACHLVGIKAAGDRAQWPSLACEHLADLIQNYTELYITKRGEIENNSLPVELWVKDVYEGGPLEPTTETWNTLNQKLIDQGLAIPVKVDNEELVCPSSDVLKELNSINKENQMTTFPKKDMLRRTVKLNENRDAQDNNNDEEDQYVEDVDSSVDDCKTVVEFTKSSVEEDNAEKPVFEKHSGTKRNLGKPGITDSVTDWLPPVPLKKSHFAAIATNVDTDAIIYLHDFEERDKLTMIQNALQSRFENSKPAPHDLYWFSGQACIAKYHGDKKWYRGKVLKVNENSTLKIIFVDYGNVEDCRATDLRKDVLLKDIPIQCHKCKLAGIEPKSGGEWDLTGLDLLHVSVVDQTTSVTIKSFPKTDGDPYLISLIGPRNINIADFMVQRNFARYIFEDYESDKECDSSADISAGVIIVDESEEFKDLDKGTVDNTALYTPDCDKEKKVSKVTDSSVTSVEVKDVLSEEKELELEESATDISDEYIQSIMQKLTCDNENPEMMDEKDPELTQTCDKMTYTPLKVPDCDQMIVDVIAMLSATEYIIAPLKWGASEDVQSRHDFVKIDEEIQLHGPLQPVLEKPTIGLPCCADYTDGRWYRAIVISLDNNEVQIQYVDYGNIESVAIDRVHEMKQEWLEVPIQVLRCKLWNLEVSETADTSEMLDCISQCLLQQNLRAVIKERHPTLIVELQKIDDGKVVYQELLESGLLKTTGSSSQQF